MTRPLTFFLVPDKGAARRLRRLLTESGPCPGVRIGSWLELVEVVKRHLLDPPIDSNWQAIFRSALVSTKGFWSKSYEADSEAVISVMEHTFRQFVTAFPPDQPRPSLPDGSISQRTQSMVADLLRLWQALGEGLPEELAIIRHALLHNNLLRPIVVHRVPEWPHLDSWAMALLHKVTTPGPDGPRQSLMERLSVPTPIKSAPGFLGTLQKYLYTSPARQVPRDDSVQWLGVRDVLEELEVAIGIIQERMRQDAKLTFADFAVLLPQNDDYLLHADITFRQAGIPLDGLPPLDTRRDIGGETVLNFLTCLRKPIPAMALASLLSSPLMPWPAATGHRLAYQVMQGKFLWENPTEDRQDEPAVIKLLRSPTENQPESLARVVRRFTDLLTSDPDMEVHKNRAVNRIHMIIEALAEMDTVDWLRLERQLTTTSFTIREEARFTQEGVAVWMENEEPWRPCRHLLVAGFTDGHFPSSSFPVSVFSSQELNELATIARWSLLTPYQEMDLRRHRFRRQLTAVDQSAVFLIARRDGIGVPRSPSSSLVFMHQHVGGVKNSEDLILDLDREEGRRQARYVPFAFPEPPSPPRMLSLETVQLNRDLLPMDKDGTLCPLSPSRMETLLLSPLAWLFEQLGATPRKWFPEQIDEAVRGILVHKVFAELFVPQSPLPDSGMIQKKIPGLLELAIQQHAPFARSSLWEVERRHLEQFIVTAALSWREVLAGLKARIVANEQNLSGTWENIPLHGRSDTLLQLPDHSLWVVDFKSGGSDKRRKRMKTGWDIQTELYQIMLRNTAAADKSKKIKKISSLYFTMGNGAVLTDAPCPIASELPCWTQVDAQVSANALTLLKNRLNNLRKGTIHLPNEDEKKLFDANSIPLYAFEASPLLERFTLPSAAPNQEEA